MRWELYPTCLWHLCPCLLSFGIRRIKIKLGDPLIIWMIKQDEVLYENGNEGFR